MDFFLVAKKLGFTPDDLVEVLDIFINVTLSDLDRMVLAATKGEAGEVSQCAHSIKGAASNFAFDEIFERAKAVETDASAGIVEGCLDAAGFIRGRVDAMRDAVISYRRLQPADKKNTAT